MVDLNICAKCPKCREYLPAPVKKDGTPFGFSVVYCELVGGISLRGDSDLPESCPYTLEQQLLQDEAFDDFESLRDELEPIKEES